MIYSILILLLIFSFSPNLAFSAATYYVDTDSIGGSSNDSPNAGTITAPWKTIDKANKTLVAGDTVYIRAGTYNIGNEVGDGGSINSQRINPSNSGTDYSNRITYSSYPGEVVNFVGISDGSVTRSRGLLLDGKSWIHVTGNSGYNMTFTNMAYGNLHIGIGGTPGNYNEIDHCDFGTYYSGYTCPQVEWRGSTVDHGSIYNHIHDNKFHDWQCYTATNDGPICLEIGIDSLDENTNYNVIENNLMYHCGHHVFGLHGRYNVARNNILHNENYWNNGGTLYGYRNFTTTIENADETLGGHHLIEGNRFGPSGVSWLSAVDPQRGGTSTYINSSYNVFRYNAIFGAVGMATNMRYYAPGEVLYNHLYNNTYFNTGYSTENDINCDERFPLHFDSDDPSSLYYNSVKNNLFHSTWPQTTTNPQQSGCGTRPITPVIYGNLTHQTVSNNLEATGTAASHFVNADISDPMSTTLPNLNLVSGSSAIDISGGGALTTANGGGSNSTALIVYDARYFQDGNFGLGARTWLSSVSIQADWIAIGTVSNTVQISSINYSTDTITLASSMTWSANANIWLYKKSDGVVVLYGSAPDYGAHEYNASVGSFTGTTTIGVTIR